MRFCFCHRCNGGRCARSTHSCGTRTTWPTSQARRSEKLRALDDWRRELDAALIGKGTAWPGLLALADTVARHGIPSNLLYEVIEGVLMDVRVRCFETFEDLADYCHHVASVVGLSCLSIWGYRSEGGKAEQFAEGYGMALQLTNIIRDVGEDARNGRIYLPRVDLARFNVQPEELTANGQPSDRIRELVAFEGQRAYQFYDQGRPLAPLVAPVGRPVLLTIVGIYRALLDEIRRRDYNVLSSRVSLPTRRKLAIAVQALAARFAATESNLASSAESSSGDSIAAPNDEINHGSSDRTPDGGRSRTRP